MDEFSFIDSIRPSYYKQPSLVKGIGDDAAVFRPSGQDVVTAVDTMVEGVHFSRKTMSPFYMGYRALAANLSDLSAMGSTPAFYLVSIVVPEEWEQEELNELYTGMKSLADEYSVDLIGGDTVSGDQLSISVTVFGYVDRGKSRYRSSAKPDDIVFVTGTLGDSRAGLEILLNDLSIDSKEAAFFIERHRRPVPRVDFAQSLLSIERVTLNDVSDGIASEAHEIAEASQVDLHLTMEDVPFTDFIKKWFNKSYKEWMLSGGEDFELIGTVAGEDWNVVEEAAKECGISITKIGTVKEMAHEQPEVYIYENNEKKKLMKSGYTHLKRGE
ncbi:thiamine-phosphate kinase [Halobacillus yeomjeoni]|uniref:Thiamine-monophosphate kinase n=1 Tax=Halobacillus yeomjeoni TaxID=311194 RepID=A0A931HY54_9BACI|nr:thiamine-phosphate kinase [Halobacillus yeomjeoni]MBH0231550.1 thiamine-phosphate kinase [Halobacillus yeomjeoni]